MSDCTHIPRCPCLFLCFIKNIDGDFRIISFSVRGALWRRKKITYNIQNFTWFCDPATSFEKYLFPRSHKTWGLPSHFWKFLKYWHCVHDQTWLWWLGQSKNMQWPILDRMRSVSSFWRCWNESCQSGFLLSLYFDFLLTSNDFCRLSTDFLLTIYLLLTNFLLTFCLLLLTHYWRSTDFHLGRMTESMAARMRPSAAEAILRKSVSSEESPSSSSLG